MWSPFLSLLTRPDAFIVNMTARIVAKLACWSREPMQGSDLSYYLTWLKDQLRAPVRGFMLVILWKNNPDFSLDEAFQIDMFILFFYHFYYYYCCSFLSTSLRSSSIVRDVLFAI